MAPLTITTIATPATRGRRRDQLLRPLLPAELPRRGGHAPTATTSTPTCCTGTSSRPPASSGTNRRPGGESLDRLANYASQTRRSVYPARSVAAAICFARVNARMACSPRGALTPWQRSPVCYDGAHGENEMHRYTRQGGKQAAEVFHRDTLGAGMRAAIEAITRGYQPMIEAWRRR